MVKPRYILTCLAALVALVQPVLAQEEMLIGVGAIAPRYVQGVKPNVLQKRLLKSIPILDTLDLPFFDDFAKQTYGIPDSKKWTDNHVFINNSFAINPPTMGVATFDILDATGRVYKYANTSQFGADTLTSQPIRLQSTDAGVYLSFAYQPQGYGDMPENRDSLTLQFFSPVDSVWVSAWGVSPVAVASNALPTRLVEKYWLKPVGGGRDKLVSNANLSTTFFNVILPVDATRFLHAGFRFRFINYATRANSDVVGMLGNCDNWNLDLVYLNKGRTASDTILIDAAIEKPVSRLLKDYQSMPWQHLKNSPTAQREQLVNNVGNGVSVSFNVDNLANLATGFVTNFEVSCVEGAPAPAPLKKYSIGTTNIQPDTTRTFTVNLPLNDILSMPSSDADSVAFDIKTIISDYNVNLQLRNLLTINDTSVFHQKLYSYYSYDDGTSEQGYGVYGVLADRSKVAVGFKAYMSDTLSGVYIYFNNTLDSGNIQPFRLGVWNDKGGVPGSALHLEPNYYVQFDSLNRFVYYKLKYPVVVEKDKVFYVGWMQQSSAMFNVGFDLNNQPSGKTFVSLDGYSWNYSKYDGQGAIMIRPSFARTTFDPYTSVNAPRKSLYNVTVYPNPVQEELRLILPDELCKKTLQLEVFNLSGQRVLHQEIFAEAAVSVSRLLQGAYFIRFSHNGKAVGYARFVKM